MSHYHLVFLAATCFLGGVLVAAQGPIYARMAGELNGNAIASAFLAFGVATLSVGLLLLASRTSLPSPGKLGAMPWWVWIGGIFGVFQVLISMNAVPHLGASLFLVLVILGNLSAGLVFDHFGFFGLNVRPVSFQSIIGVVLVLGGVIVVFRQ